MTDRRATFEEVKSSMIPNPDHESKTKGLRCAERNIEGERLVKVRGAAGKPRHHTEISAIKCYSLF